MRPRLRWLISRKRVARHVASAVLEGLIRRTGWRRAKPGTVVLAYDLFGRSFRPAGPDQRWFADITQHPTRKGWLFSPS